jgi:hypothetical protein
MDLSRSVYYYKSHRDDGLVIDKLQTMVEQRPTEGFWKMYYRIRKEGLLWNHKRIHRVYKQLKFNIKRKGKRTTSGAHSTTIRSGPKNERQLVDGFHDRLTFIRTEIQDIKYYGRLQS